MVANRVSQLVTSRGLARTQLNPPSAHPSLPSKRGSLAAALACTIKGSSVQSAGENIGHAGAMRAQAMPWCLLVARPMAHCDVIGGWNAGCSLQCVKGVKAGATWTLNRKRTHVSTHMVDSSPDLKAHPCNNKAVPTTRAAGAGSHVSYHVHMIRGRHLRLLGGGQRGAWTWQNAAAPSLPLSALSNRYA